jgi:type IV secretory pathway VirB6-like protein
LTEGTTQAKAGILSGGIVMLWGVLTAVAWYLQGENLIVFMAVMYAIITAPMFISGMLHLNDDGGDETPAEVAAE